MKKEEALNTLAMVMETPLDEVIECIHSGKFGPSPDEPIGENESIIGELTTLEKAVMTVRDFRGEQANKVAQANNDMVDSWKRLDQPIDEKMVEENKLSNKTNRILHDFFENLLWSSIKKRLGTPAIQSFGIGIRAEYKIVSFPPSEEDMKEMFARKLMRSGHPLGMMAAFAAMHDDE